MRTLRSIQLPEPQTRSEKIFRKTLQEPLPSHQLQPPRLPLSLISPVSLIGGAAPEEVVRKKIADSIFGPIVEIRRINTGLKKDKFITKHEALAVRNGYPIVAQVEFFVCRSLFRHSLYQLSFPNHHHFIPSFFI